MEKFTLDYEMVEHIEYMRNQDGVSLYGIIKSINETSNSELFNNHADVIIKYFNDFDDTTDDENFMKCMLGHYDVKLNPDAQVRNYYYNVVIPKTTSMNKDVYLEGTIEASAIEKILKMLNKFDIVE